jgi:hypothetical protein
MTIAGVNVQAMFIMPRSHSPASRSAALSLSQVSPWRQLHDRRLAYDQQLKFFLSCLRSPLSQTVVPGIRFLATSGP